MRLWQRVTGVAAVIVAAAVLAPAAMASATVSITRLSPSTSAAASTSDNLTLDLAFADTGSDTPENLTLVFPPGLLANAAADGGQCLKTSPTANSAPPASCQVGTASVTVEASLPIGGILGTPVPVPITQTVDFYLVAPQRPGDLAGLDVYDPAFDEELGSPGYVFIRPSSSGDGVGATISLTLPDRFPVSFLGVEYPTAAIQIESIDNTLTGLRNPATCPSGGLPFGVTSTSEAGDPSSTSAPLDITGCSSLQYDPQFSVTAVKDSGDKETALTTNVAETEQEAPSGAISLSFPTALFAANLRALPLLCTTSVSRCTPVGSVTADSPLYPTPLTGEAYLTGTSSGLTLTLTFPSPFPITLVGTVSLVTNTAAFSGLPDIPLTQLAVKLNGGSQALFATACRVSSGTAVGKFLTVNGDHPRTELANFTVSGCPGSSGGGGTWSSSGSGSWGGSGSCGCSSTSSSTTSDWNGTTHLVADKVSGLRRGRPWLRFTVAVRRHAPKFDRLAVVLPAGLTVRTYRDHRRILVRGVSLKGARIKSLRLVDHDLVITLRRSARSVTVTLDTRTLKESQRLRAEIVRRSVTRLRLRVAVRDARGKTRLLTVTVRRLDS